jgi:hypothetical protein
MSTHIKTKKHQNGGKTNAMNEEQLKEYHKKYYIEKNLKDKYKEKKKCECCNIMVAKYNWSKHIQTEKHFKKQHQLNNPETPYIRNRLIKDDDNTNESIFISKDICDNNIQQTELEESLKSIDYVQLLPEEKMNKFKPKPKPKPPTKKKKIDDLEPNVEKYIKELTNIENPLMQYYIDELGSAIKEMKFNISI